MMILHDGTAAYKEIVPNLAEEVLPPGVVWVDVLNGTPEEFMYVERVLGRHLPTLAELSEVESSSRLHFDDGVFSLSTPLVSRNPQELPQALPVGFILTKKVLVTIRFARLTAFTNFAEAQTKPDSAQRGSSGVFVGLLEAIIDRAADILEEVGGELDHVSQAVFYKNTTAALLKQSPVRQVAGKRT